MYDVITVGSSTVDVFAKTAFSELIKIVDSKGERDLLAYPTGSKILLEKLEFTTGGGATNTAVALSRLGHKVACISKTGCGSNAEKVRKHLQKEKVDTSLMVCDKNGRTGYSIILDSLEHDRTILTFKGSNNDLRFSEINLRKLNTRWFYFSTMMGESFKTLEKLSEFAEKEGIKIAFNISQYLAEKGIDCLREILKRTEILVLNREEAFLLFKNRMMEGGIDRKAEVRINSRIDNRIGEILKEIRRIVKIVVITDGKKEVYACNGNEVYTLKPDNIKPVETTGAGDAFAATFLSGMIKRNDIEFALKLAAANAESVILHYGAKNKLLTYKEAIKAVKEKHLRTKKLKVH